MSMSDVEPSATEHPLHHLFGRPSRPMPFGPLTGASALLVNGAGLWVGIGIEETTGLAAARAVIGDGNAQGITVPFMPYTLAINESRADMWPTHGMMFDRGLVITATTGTVAGSLLVVMLTRREAEYVQSLRQGFA